MSGSGLVGGSRLFVGSGFSGEAGLVGGSVLGEGIEKVGGSGLVGGSRLFGGSGLSREVGLTARLGSVGGPGLVSEAGLVGGSWLEGGIGWVVVELLGKGGEVYSWCGVSEVSPFRGS